MTVVIRDDKNELRSWPTVLFGSPADSPGSISGGVFASGGRGLINTVITGQYIEQTFEYEVKAPSWPGLYYGFNIQGVVDKNGNEVGFDLLSLQKQESVCHGDGNNQNGENHCKDAEALEGRPKARGFHLIGHVCSQPLHVIDSRHGEYPHSKRFHHGNDEQRDAGVWPSNTKRDDVDTRHREVQEDPRDHGIHPVVEPEDELI